MGGAQQLSDGATRLLQQIWTRCSGCRYGGNSWRLEGTERCRGRRLLLLLLDTADATATAAHRLDHVLLHILGGIEGGHGAMYARHGRCWYDGRTLSEHAACGQAALLALLLVIIVSMTVIGLVQQLLALDEQIQAHISGCGRYNLTIGQLEVAHIRFGIQPPIDDNCKRQGISLVFCISHNMGLPLTTSSRHLGHMRAVTLVVAPKSGLELISMSHG